MTLKDRLLPADKAMLLELAARLSACAEDAKRPEPVLGHDNVVRPQPPAIVSLANAVEAIAAALKAIAHKMGDK